MASRNIITHNFGWKLLSLALAALTWLTIETEFQRKEKSDAESRQTPVTTTSSKKFPFVPLTLLAAPSNTNRFKVSPDTVEVEIGGDEQELKTLQLREVQAFVDVSDAQDEKQFRRPIQIRVPKDFTVATNDPSNASVERITPAR